MAIGGIGKSAGTGAARFKAQLAARRERNEQVREARQRQARETHRANASALGSQLQGVQASYVASSLTLTLQAIQQQQATEKQGQLSALQSSLSGLSD